MLKKIIKISVWIIFLAISYRYSLAKYYIIFSAFYLIWNNLGQAKPGDISAYSVFNKDGKRLAGTFQGRQMMGMESGNTNNIITLDEQPSNTAQYYYKHVSKMANQECFCNSGKKFKKCCMNKQQNKQQ